MSTSAPGSGQAGFDQAGFDQVMVDGDAHLLRSLFNTTEVVPLVHSAHARIYRLADSAGTRYVAKLVAPTVMTSTAALYAALGDTAGVNPLIRHGEMHGIGYLLFSFHERSLADRAALAPMPIGEAQTVLAPVAEALERLHHAGYAHADVKPGNIWYATDHGWVLTDLDEAVPLGTPTARYTPGYSAPEQHSGQALTPAADYLSFAVTLAATVRNANQISTVVATADHGTAPVRRLAPRALLASLATATDVGSPLPSGTGAAPSGYRGQPNPHRDLVVTAQRMLGSIDLNARTLNRLPLQIHPPLPDEPEHAVERSLWRHPAMIAALIGTAIMVVLAVVLMV